MPNLKITPTKFLDLEISQAQCTHKKPSPKLERAGNILQYTNARERQIIQIFKSAPLYCIYELCEDDRFNVRLSKCQEVI